jgi:hypothetical protein
MFASSLSRPGVTWPDGTSASSARGPDVSVEELSLANGSEDKIILVLLLVLL